MGVRCVCMHAEEGGLGACSPMKYSEILDALRLLLRPFWDRSRQSRSSYSAYLVCILFGMPSLHHLNVF